MLKYDRIIRNLDMDEKLEIVTSESYLLNHKTKYFDIPEYRVVRMGYELSYGKNVFPSYLSLASSYNLDLIRKTSSEIGLNFKKNKVSTMVGVEAMPYSIENKNGFTSDPYLSSKIASSMILGLHDSNFPSMLSNIPNGIDNEAYRIEKLTPMERIIKSSDPFAISGDEDYYKFLLKQSHQGLVVSTCKTKDGLIRALKLGTSIVVGDGFDAKDAILEAITAYDLETKRYLAKEITLAEYQSLIRNGNIFNPVDLDPILDNLMDSLRGLQASLDEATDFNTFDGKKQALESIVLLKNDSVLPLFPKTRVALVGDAIDLISSNTEGEIDSIEKLIPVLRKGTLGITGYAHGYVKNKPLDQSLVSKAISLIESSDITLAFFDTNKETGAISKEQLEFLSILRNSQKKTIAVIQSENEVDLEPFEFCSAILFTGYAYNGLYNAIAEILSGDANPCGHLPFKMGKYPIAYGLSYTSFQYSNFRIEKKGVCVYVKNTGNVPGACLVLLYINGKTQGFSKVNVGVGEIKRIDIPFDEFTFRYYDEVHKCYGVRSGKYTIALGINESEIVFESDVTLEGELFNPDGFKTDSSYDIKEFNQKPVDLKKEHRPLSKAKKLSILIPTVSYFYIMFILLLVMGIMYEYIPVIIAMVACLLINSAIFALFLVKILKTKYKEEIKQDANLEYTMMLEDMDSFQELAHESFLEPVFEKKEEEEIDKIKPAEEAPATVEENEDLEELKALEEAPIALEENKEEAKEEVKEEVKEEIDDFFDDDDDIVEEEEIFDEYATVSEEEEEVIDDRKHVLDLLGETVTDNLVYSSIDISNLASDFVKYAGQKGLTVEQESARLLFASLTASHILLLKTASMDLSIKLVKILEKYLGNKGNYYLSKVNNSYEKFHDLMWEVDENGDYAPTDLLYYLLKSEGLPKHTHIMGLYDVDINSITKYFKPFIRYSASPLDSHRLDLQIDNIKYYLPDNIYALLIPRDPAFLEDIPQTLLGSTIYVELQVRESEPYKDESYKKTYFSHFYFQDAVRLGKETNYIDEETWKKLDEFEDELAQYEGHFRIGNKKTLIIERMASFLFLNGAHKDDVLDTVFAANIVPILKTTKTYKNVKGDETILAILDKVFGLDNLPKTNRVLKKQERIILEDEEEIEEVEEETVALETPALETPALETPAEEPVEEEAPAEEPVEEETPAEEMVAEETVEEAPFEETVAEEKVTEEVKEEVVLETKEAVIEEAKEEKTEKICPSCGAKLPIKLKFCTECGTKQE